MNRKLTDDEREEIREATKLGVIVQEDPATSALVTLREREADDEILGRSITLRWGKRQIDVVRRAAELLGVPYQTYLKQVVFKQALEDIARVEAVLGQDQTRARPPRKSSDKTRQRAGKASKEAGAA